LHRDSQVHNLPAVSQSFSSATSKKQKSSVEEEEEGELLGEEEVNVRIFSLFQHYGLF